MSDPSVTDALLLAVKTKYPAKFYALRSSVRSCLGILMPMQHIVSVNFELISQLRADGMRLDDISRLIQSVVGEGRHINAKTLQSALSRARSSPGHTGAILPAAERTSVAMERVCNAPNVTADPPVVTPGPSDQSIGPVGVISANGDYSECRSDDRSIPMRGSPIRWSGPHSRRYPQHSTINMIVRSQDIK